MTISILQHNFCGSNEKDKGYKFNKLDDPHVNLRKQKITIDHY